MQQQKLGSRVDVAELKDLIVKRLGEERSKRYFYYLNRLLNQKVSKKEFNKLCQQVLGRENLQLHNHLVRSILKNVCNAKTPPVCEESSTRTAAEAGRGPGDLQFGVPSTSAVTWENGVASRRKVRLDNHVWKFRNGHSLAENEKDKSMEQPLRRKCPSGSVDGLVSLCKKDKVVEQSRKASPASNSDTRMSYWNTGELSDTDTIQIRMEQIAAMQNLGGVSLECASLLNRMLDVYLKGLIKSCINLVEAKSGNETKSPPVPQKQHIQGKYLNGLLPNNQLLMATSSPVRTMFDERPHPAISLQDFKVAMELNPRQLGEDWPLNFEKICMYSFEE